MINDIEIKARQMAGIQTGMFRWWKYKASNNPHLNKKNAITWHNAFYDECKIIGRSVM